MARVRIEIPSARAETSAHVRSRSACSSRHAARETRASTRRSRRAAAIRSLIVTRPACHRVQETGRRSGAHGSIVTGTPIDTVLVAAAAVVLTIAGQAIIERSDIRAVFEANPGPGIPATFPATPPLAGAAFTAMLQLSLVCERWPLGSLGRFRSGLAALALSWAAGTGAYFLFINFSAVPAFERAAAGLRNPGGPITAPDFGSALIAVGVWQAVFFIALRGWPVNTITRRLPRLLAGNALVIGLGALTYTVLRDLAHWQPAAISAACGCVISAALIVAMLFEGWPAARLPPAPGRVLTLILTALVALALNRALAAYADGVHWTRATPASSEPASSCTSASGSAGRSP